MSQPIPSLTPPSSTGNVDDTNYVTDWEWYEVKWGIIGAIVLFFILFVLGGLTHAKRRMRKGLPLLAYHRWLVPRSWRTTYEAQRNGLAQPMYGGYGGSAYPMNNFAYGAPPPAYNPENDYVPPYAPPAGGSKVNPDQGHSIQAHTQEVGVVRGQSYTAPAGPPPARMRRLDEDDFAVGPSRLPRIASPYGK